MILVSGQHGRFICSLYLRFRNNGSPSDSRRCSSTPQAIVLAQKSRRYFPIVEYGKEFVVILIPDGLSSELSR